MNKTEIAAAKDLARSDADLSTAQVHLLFGCALPGFAPVIVSQREVAALFRDFLFFDGSGFDEALMNDCGLYRALRHRVTVA